MSQVCQRCQREKPDDRFAVFAEDLEVRLAKVCLDCAQIIVDDFNERDGEA